MNKHTVIHEVEQKAGGKIMFKNLEEYEKALSRKGLYLVQNTDTTFFVLKDADPVPVAWLDLEEIKKDVEEV